MKTRNGRRPYSVRESMLTAIVLRQMELMREIQQKPKGNRWELLLKRLIFAAGFLVAGAGLDRLFG